MKVANARPQKRAIASPWTFMTFPPQLDGGRPLILVAEDEAIIAFELEDSLRAAGSTLPAPSRPVPMPSDGSRQGVPLRQSLTTLSRTVLAMRLRAISRPAACR